MAVTTKQKTAGAGLLLLCLTLVPLAGWGLLSDLAQQQQAVESGRQLIVHSSMHGLAPAGILLCLILIFWVCAILLGHKIPTLASEKSLNNGFGRLVLASFALMLIGYYGLSYYWQTKLADKGYERCPATTLLFTRVTYSAWALDPTLCYDADVKRIVQRGSWNESAQVEQMLQRRARQQEARRQFLLQEEQLKQQRQQQAKKGTAVP